MSTGNRPCIPSPAAAIRFALLCALAAALGLLARHVAPPPDAAHNPPATETAPMDDIDRCTHHQQNMLEQRLAQRVRYQGESATHCHACGEPIPKRRRELIAGCRTCADYQSLIEQRGYA